MEKILEKKLDGSPENVRSLIRKRLTELQQQYSKEENEYNIGYEWKGHDRVVITSDYISGEIAISPKKLIVHAKIPFFMLPFKKKCIDVLKGEVQKLFA